MLIVNKFYVKYFATNYVYVSLENCSQEHIRVLDFSDCITWI